MGREERGGEGMGGGGLGSVTRASDQGREIEEGQGERKEAETDRQESICVPCALVSIDP